jgi:Putative esterase
MNCLPWRLLAVLTTTMGAVAMARAAAPAQSLRITVSFPASRSATPLDGRLLLIVATSPTPEPRFAVSEHPDTQQIFGFDVTAWHPGKEAVFDASAFGFPIASLAELPPGEYWVQALFHRYETFHRADGHVVELPPDRGEGQQWNKAPGNLYSAPVQVHLDPTAGGRVSLSLTEEIPPIPPPEDTKYVKHIRIQSALLSRFWGRPMFLGATVLLPAGFDEHPHAHYPLVIFHGHFERDFEGFREVPPDPSLPEPDMEWLRAHCRNGHNKECDAHGYAKLSQRYAHDFYKLWTGPDFPRVLLVTIQHANPYYDDSYAVNSANLGPYGDAITRELIPYIEERYRGLGAWARALAGGSTGGWEALAAQIFYPDEYNGAWACCPDPIDFRAYTVVNIYEDENAYFIEGPFGRVAQPEERDYLGHVTATLEDANHLELVLGSHGRSGNQWDIWQAVFGPVGEDGYPQPIWDKKTGVIDHGVAEYWKDHYDLRAVLARDWPRLGPRLRGKLHLFVGEADSFYLNDAVYLMDDFLKQASDPPADATVAYGPRAEHCWSGDFDNPNFISRLTYAQRFIPRMVEHWLATAPPGADTKSWRY